MASPALHAAYRRLRGRIAVVTVVIVALSVAAAAVMPSRPWAGAVIGSGLAVVIGAVSVATLRLAVARLDHAIVWVVVDYLVKIALVAIGIVIARGLGAEVAYLAAAAAVAAVAAGAVATVVTLGGARIPTIDDPPPHLGSRSEDD